MLRKIAEHCRLHGRLLRLQLSISCVLVFCVDGEVASTPAGGLCTCWRMKKGTEVGTDVEAVSVCVCVCARMHARVVVSTCSLTVGIGSVHICTSLFLQGYWCPSVPCCCCHHEIHDGIDVSVPAGLSFASSSDWSPSFNNLHSQKSICMNRISQE